jgi:hypothetical protein
VTLRLAVLEGNAQHRLPFSELPPRIVTFRDTQSLRKIFEAK